MIRLEFGTKEPKRSTYNNNLANKSSSFHAYVRKIGVFADVQNRCF